MYFILLKKYKLVLYKIIFTQFNKKQYYIKNINTKNLIVDQIYVYIIPKNN